jgi:Fe-S-cluster containining protein
VIDKKRIGSCKQCGRCCRDFVIEVKIGNVTDYEFTDYMRWIGGHVGVQADIRSFRDRTADLHVKSPCKHLVNQGDGTFTCAIQDTKPDICRRYPEEDYGDEISAHCSFRFVDLDTKKTELPD